jgi:L-ascorbate metabolism protein UlaG (beta-lactamase superfamily)
MSVTYFGHSAFLFEDASGERLLIDPFGNDADNNWFLTAFPSLDVDLVAVTHDHFDHNAVEALPGGTPVMLNPGVRQIGNTIVTGVCDLHSGASGRAGMPNVIFLIEHEGVGYCHVGDNRHDLPDEVVQQLGKVDVLLAPADDSCHLLTFDEVDSLVALLDPKIVIPMHYYIEGLTTLESTLEGSGGWVRKQSPRRTLRQSRMRIDRRGLPYEREVWTVRAELAS